VERIVEGEIFLKQLGVRREGARAVPRRPVLRVGTVMHLFQERRQVVGVGKRDT